MNTSLPLPSLEQLFLNARTYNDFEPTKIPNELLKQVYDLAKFGPTAANSCPARFVFITSDEAKEKLLPHLMEGNVEKTKNAPCTVIVAYDTKFYEHLDVLFPHTNARSWFEGNEESIKYNSLMNGSLQAGYFIMAARAMGLDCGPMGGFNKDKVNEIFFKDTNWSANFLINLGYGTEDGAYPRNPRLDFDKACKII